MFLILNTIYIYIYIYNQIVAISEEHDKDDGVE